MLFGYYVLHEVSSLGQISTFICCIHISSVYILRWTYVPENYVKFIFIVVFLKIKRQQQNKLNEVKVKTLLITNTSNFWILFQTKYNFCWSRTTKLANWKGERKSHIICKSEWNMMVLCGAISECLLLMYVHLILTYLFRNFRRISFS